jgi:hypothetical protein
VSEKQEKEATKKDKKEPSNDKSKRLTPVLLKQLDIDPRKILHRNEIERDNHRKGPVIFKDKGQIVLHEKDATTNSINNREVVMIKNAKEFTEKLDRIADEIEALDPQHGPVLALYLDKVSDVIEGKKEATTLKHDADEWYMNNRFNTEVRKREADEPYMDEYNKNNFEQVIDVKRSPVPIKKASVPYQKVE